MAAAGAELSGNDDPSLLTVGLWGSVALFAAVGAVVQYRRDLSDRRAGGPDGRAGQDPSFCQLPPDITDFTGRETAVTEVEQYFAGWWESDVEAPPICAISGMGGVGKTAFAVHVAHRLRERYPDGQFYVNLRGAEKSRLEPGGVLSDFLRTLGAEGPAIPVGVEARAALYRSKLVGRRMLVVLDNAAEEAQVRPLLPGTWSCGVLVTSRRPMTGLEGTRCVSMDVMDEESGRTLLVRILGADRVGREPAAADELLRLCGYLPLAIRVAAGRLLAKPHWTIADSVDRLRRQRQRLGELQHGDLDVRASLKLSFDALSGTDRDSFSRLGLLRARDFGVWPVSALLDSTAEVAADFVERMVEAQLVDVLGRDINGRLRFQLHDLVHDFAVQLAGELPDDVRAAAIERLAGAHLTLITAAEDRFQPGEIRIVGDAPRWGDADLIAAELSDPVGWFTVERSSLVTMVRYAFDRRMWSATWEIAHALAVFFEMRAHWDDWSGTHDLALTAARNSNDRSGEAAILFDLAALHRDKGQSVDALRCYRRAFQLFRSIDDRHGVGISSLGLGIVYRNERKWSQAERKLRAAAVILEETGDERLTAQSLRSLAIVLAEQGRSDEAESRFRSAGEVFARLGDRRAEAYNWRGLGDLYRHRGDVTAADECFQRSLRMVAELGDRRGEARALQGSGRTLFAAGQVDAAAELFDRALEVVDGLGDAVLESSLRADQRRLPGRDPGVRENR